MNIVGVSAKWAPGERFASMLADATFQNVPARNIMRKLMKSIKAGELIVGLRDSDLSLVHYELYLSQKLLRS